MNTDLFYVQSRILIASYNKFQPDESLMEIGYTGLYNKNHDPLYDYSHDHFDKQFEEWEKSCSEFTEKLFGDILESVSVSEIDQLWNNSRNFHYLILEKAGYLTKNEYINIISCELKKFRDFYSIAKALNAYHESKNAYYEDEERQAVVNALNVCLEHDTTVLCPEDGLYLSVFEEYRCEYNDEGEEETEIIRHDLKPETMPDQEISSWLDSCEQVLNDFLQEKIKQLDITFSGIDGTITFFCHSLLEAMYVYAVVSIINQNEYKKCSKPGCQRYFRVDKHHPQKFCDIHMAPRRKKRENAYKKEKAKKECELKEDGSRNGRVNFNCSDV